MTSDWPWTPVKSTLYTLITYPKAQISSILLYKQLFLRYKVAEIRNALNDIRMTLDTQLSKIPYIHWILILTPEAQILIHSTLWPAVCERQGCWKPQMHQMSPDWPWTLNCQRYPICTEYLPSRAQISLCFALRGLLFEIISSFFSLYDTISTKNESEISTKKSWKIVNSKFKKCQAVLLWRPLRRKFRSSKNFKSDWKE